MYVILYYTGMVKFVFECAGKNNMVFRQLLCKYGYRS